MRNGTIKVLLVEDNVADAVLLRTSLSETTFGKFEVVDVRRLEEAIARLNQETFDLVLLDLGLPDSQGLETLQRIKPHADNIALVVMTGLADEDLGVSALQEGAQDYLVKGHLNPSTLARPLRYAAERKAIQTALVTSEYRLAMALKAADIGIWDWDLRKGSVTTSECHARMFDLPPASEWTYPFDLLHEKVHPEDRAEQDRMLREAMAAHAEFTHQFRILRSDHTVRWAETRGRFLYGDDSRPVRMMGTVIDITDRKQHEEVAKRREAEMAHLARTSTMGQMAAGLAHELNQPLGAILNYASVVQMQMQSDKPSAQMMSSAIDEVMNETRRAGAIISRLRSFLRKQMPRAEAIDLNDLIAEAFAMLEFELRHQGIRPQLRFAESLPKVMADTIQIEQVLVNLIFNALEAMDHARSPVKSITVHTGLSEDGTSAEVSVIDSGPGISPDLMDRLFQPFFTTKPTGLGMGLNICRSIIESHGGRLGAFQNPEGGMRFSFTLPLATE